jgi:hypothetical protein
MIFAVPAVASTGAWLDRLRTFGFKLPGTQ